MPMLSHALVHAPDRTPARWMFFLHGIFGSGSNWRTFARRLVAARPSWGAVLVDLRAHGGSQGFAPPNTLAAAADDLIALEATLPGPVGGVLGHSFGGKVALTYVERRRGQLEQAWVLDSMPGTRADARGSEATVGVLHWLERVGRTFPSREAFVQRMLDDGFARDIAQWLAMNVRSEGDEYVFRLDLGAIRELLDDYFRTDLWPLVAAPPGQVQLQLVIGGRSPVFSSDDRARAAAIAAASHDRVHVHTLASAGHWLHVDDPEGLFAIVREGVPD